MSQLGKDAVLKLDNAAGSLQDLSSDGMSINPSWNRDDHDVTTFGNTGHRHKPGIQNNSFTVEFNYSDAVYTHLTALRGVDVSQSFEIYPKGTTSGYPKESGECFLTNLSLPRDAINPEKIQATFVVDGAVAFGSAT
jgi:hypothetical protein